ncbi:MAG: NADPH:quinone oxidoreductase family protein [Boseongicola sp.]|nr:NADPH:quinone oxidoreductase family protein [Boseongicola sp.]
MRAWVSAEPGLGNLEVRDLAKPVPEDGLLLVRVTHAALNYSDLLMLVDQYQVRPPRPFALGQEIVGIVEEAPRGSGFERGDRIASKVLWGGFADFALTRADMAIRVPDSFSLASAAALPVSYSTALVAIDYCGKLSSGEYALIHAAAGGVGLAAVEIASARGATVIATAGTKDRLAVTAVHGATHCVNYRDTDWVDQVNTLTGGKGADMILDPVGGEIGEASLRCIALDGRYLIVGFASGAMPKLAANRLLLKRASAIGVYWNHDRDRALIADTNREMESLIKAGQINPVIDDRHGFDDLPQALDDLRNRRVVGKMVLRVDAEREGTE